MCTPKKEFTMWRKVQFGLIIALTVSFLYCGKALRNPTPIPCDHTEHTCAVAGHTWETEDVKLWGTGSGDTRVTNWKIYELLCEKCGVRKSQKIVVNGNEL